MMAGKQYTSMFTASNKPIHLGYDLVVLKRHRDFHDAFLFSEVYIYTPVRGSFTVFAVKVNSLFYQRQTAARSWSSLQKTVSTIFNF